MQCSWTGKQIMAGDSSPQRRHLSYLPWGRKVRFLKCWFVKWQRKNSQNISCWLLHVGGFIKVKEANIINCCWCHISELFGLLCQWNSTNITVEIPNTHCTTWGPGVIQHEDFLCKIWTEKQRRNLSPLISQKCHTPRCKHQGSHLELNGAHCDVKSPIVE